VAFEGFVFSDESSDLTDQEFEQACSTLDAIERVLQERIRLALKDPERAKTFMPDEGWHPDSQPSFELDGSTKNAQTSYDLLARKDRDIIRKMRLYGHSFTGYQLATLELAEKRPWVSEKLPDNWDDSLRQLAGPPDQSVFDYVKVSSELPDHLRLSPPRKFGEIGWVWDGKIVNEDTYAYQERFCLMEENGLFELLSQKIEAKGHLTMVEIGGGYGALGYFLMKLYGEKLHYIIIDIPESLAFSAIYLSTLFPQLQNRIIETEKSAPPLAVPGFTFLPNMHADLVTALDQPVDLVLNTLSLSEMSDAQIHDYCRLAADAIRSDGLFFEQNHQSDHQGPGGIPPQYLRNLKPFATEILPESFPARRGDANLWASASYEAE